MSFYGKLNFFLFPYIIFEYTNKIILTEQKFLKIKFLIQIYYWSKKKLSFLTNKKMLLKKKIEIHMIYDYY